MNKLLLLLLVCISLNTIAQDTLRFETFHRYVEVDKIPPNNVVKVNIDEARTGYIILTTDTIIIVDQYGTTVEYKVYFRRSLDFYYLKEEDYAYFIQDIKSLMFIVRTNSKNFYYYIVKES